MRFFESVVKSLIFLTFVLLPMGSHKGLPSTKYRIEIVILDPSFLMLMFEILLQFLFS